MDSKQAESATDATRGDAHRREADGAGAPRRGGARLRAVLAAAGCGRRRSSRCSSPCPGSACGWRCRARRASAASRRSPRCFRHRPRAARAAAAPRPRARRSTASTATRGAPHRPAASLDDRLAMAGEDPADRGAVGAAPRPPRPPGRAIRARRCPRRGMAWRDPRALRFGVAAAALAAALVAGPERYGRVAAAFDWRGGAAAAAAGAARRLDRSARLRRQAADPARRSPPIATRRRRSSRRRARRWWCAPTPSVFETRVEGAIAPVAGDKAAAEAPATARDGRADREALDDRRRRRGRASAATASRFARFEIAATPLGAPTITLLEPPRANLSGSLTLHYSLADRYGVPSAEAEFAKPAAPSEPRRRASLVRAAEAAAAPAQHGERNRRSEHDRRPLRTSLGGRSGRDDARRRPAFPAAIGAGAPTTFTLPQRAVPQPARARAGRAAARARPRPRPRAAASRQGDRRADDRAGLLPDAGRRLSRPAPGARAPRRRAWRRRSPRASPTCCGRWRCRSRTATPRRRSATCAPPSRSCARRCNAARATRRLRKLTQELRDAAERYMRDLAEQAPQQQNDADAQLPAEKDLESRCSTACEDMARNGARQDAEAMLDQMQNMFENMRGARDAQEDPASREMRKQIDELGKLLRDQQALRDDTFRQDQREQLGRDAPERPGRSGQSVARRAPARAARPPGRVAAAAKGLGHEGREGLRRRARRHEGGRGRPQGRRPGPRPGRGRPRPGRQELAAAGEIGADRQGPRGRSAGPRARGAAAGRAGPAAAGAGPGQWPRRPRLQGDRPAAGRRRTRARPARARGAAIAAARSRARCNGGADVAERARRVLEELRRRLADPEPAGAKSATISSGC